MSPQSASGKDNQSLIFEVGDGVQICWPWQQYDERSRKVVQHCTVGWDAYDFKAKAGSLVFNIVLIISKLFIFPALNTLHPNIFLLSSFENGDSFTADLAKYF